MTNIMVQTFLKTTYNIDIKSQKINAYSLDENNNVDFKRSLCGDSKDCKSIYVRDFQSLIPREFQFLQYAKLVDCEQF
jgi:hypothetical protein